MNSTALSYQANKYANKSLTTLGLIVFVLILVFNSTFFRIRPMEEIPTLDWLVIARLLSSSLALLIGTLLILRSWSQFRFSSILIFLFSFASILSAINSPYPTIVIGYAILLIGASVLIIGLVHNAKDVVQLETIEKIWFFTIIACVLKDAITSLIFPDPETQGEIVRLGMGITHANQLSLLAAIIFWLSFKQGRCSRLIWVIRLLLIGIILGAISRISIAAFMVAGFVYYFLKVKDTFNKLAYVSICATLIVLVLLIFSFIPQLKNNVFLYAKRGQTKAEMFSFNERTYIWQHALHQVPEAPLIGHGYGITRFTLELGRWDFQASHCHNDFLEEIFSMGLFGFIPLVFMYLYSLRWITRFKRLSFAISFDYASHAILVVMMLWVRAMFEPNISGTLTAFQPLFFYYLVTLDREKFFFLLRSMKS
jgi:O-antigen ligase